MPLLTRGLVRNPNGLRKALTVVGSVMSGASLVAFLVLVLTPAHRDRVLCLFRDACTPDPDGIVAVVGAAFGLASTVGVVVFGALRLHETLFDRRVLHFQRHFDSVYALPRLLEHGYPATAEQLQALASTIDAVPHQAGLIAELFEKRISAKDDASEPMPPAYAMYWNSWVWYWANAIGMFHALAFVLAACVYWAVAGVHGAPAYPVPSVFLALVLTVLSVQLSLAKSKGRVRRAFNAALKVVVRDEREALVRDVTKMIGDLVPTAPIPIREEARSLVIGTSAYAPGNDVFVAGVMSMLTGRGAQDSYAREHRRAALVAQALVRDGFTVRSPLAERKHRDDFIDPATALRLNHEVLRKTRCLVVILTHNRASSALIELGWMMGWGRPIVVLHSRDATLPYLLRKPTQVFPSIHLRMCLSDDEFAEAAVEETRRVLGRGPGPADPQSDVRRTA